MLPPLLALPTARPNVRGTRTIIRARGRVLIRVADVRSARVCMGSSRFAGFGEHMPAFVVVETKIRRIA